VVKDWGFFYLFSDVLVDSHLILSMKGGGMTARVWSGPTTNSTLLLTTGQAVTNGISVVNGQVVNFATHGEVSEVWLQVLAPGKGSISYGFVGTDDAEGISFTDTLNITAYRDKLYVQVMAESDYMTGLGFGPAVNGAAVSAFSLSGVMQSVADLYADPERGAGIDLEWVTTTFTMPVVPHTYANIDNETVLDLYKYTGDIECVAYNEAPPHRSHHERHHVGFQGHETVFGQSAKTRRNLWAREHEYARRIESER